MKRLLVVLSLGLVVLLLAACGSSATPTPRPAPAAGGPSAADAREVRIYQINASTGQSASFGTRSIAGVELAAKHL